MSQWLPGVSQPGTKYPANTREEIHQMIPLTNPHKSRILLAQKNNLAAV
ncbi:hypothetical protein ACGVWS_11475 [Enterobacteriaceae bacterium LUAb1]